MFDKMEQQDNLSDKFRCIWGSPDMDFNEKINLK